MWFFFFNTVHVKRSVERRRKTTARDDLFMDICTHTRTHVLFIYYIIFGAGVIDEKLITAKPLSSGHKLLYYVRSCVDLCGTGIIIIIYIYEYNTRKRSNGMGEKKEKCWKGNNNNLVQYLSGNRSDKTYTWLMQPPRRRRRRHTFTHRNLTSSCIGYALLALLCPVDINKNNNIIYT